MKTLLLNSSYELISFIDFRKLIKFLIKNKVEIISEWDDNYITISNTYIKYPSVIRLKYYIKNIPLYTRFYRKGVLRRDNFRCQYCNKKSTRTRLTIDHIMPKSKGGGDTWANCVAACTKCNSKKGNRTPDEANMRLLSEPRTPTNPIVVEYMFLKPKHEDWKLYFSHWFN